MVLIEDERAGSWSWPWSPLRRSTGKEKREKELVGSAPAAGESVRAFDIADSMEKGLARELVADFVRPLRHANNLWKFCVERSADQRQFWLHCNSGEFLMFAQISGDSRRVDFFLYDPREEEGALYDPERPAFTMSSNASKTEWRLTQERCEDLCYSPKHLLCSDHRKQEVLCVQHSRSSVGNGVSNCMEVHILLDGYALQGAIVEEGGCEEQVLTTKMPVWNDEVESLVLDFKGRQVLPSAKNFQLAMMDRPKEVVCQYGKIGPNTFGLDFRYPLTVIQAFGCALTTLHWI